ncbi:N-acetylmuramoyl-L-alanine amidase, partial [Rhodothermus marinus]
FLGLHKTEAARRVMERENSVVRLEDDPSQYEHFTEQELILMTLAQSAYLRKSEKLAMLVQEQFAERVGRVNRGVKQAGFYVLWSASMPAILVELGFLTNPQEAAFLKSKEGQAYMASAIFRAVRTFKEHYERELAFPAAR